MRKEKFTEGRSKQFTLKSIYFMVFQSKIVCKNELASFLTSIADCGKPSVFYTLKIIFIVHLGHLDHFE